MTGDPPTPQLERDSPTPPYRPAAGSFKALSTIILLLLSTSNLTRMRTKGSKFINRGVVVLLSLRFEIVTKNLVRRTHKRLYYDDETQSWTKKVCTEEEFDDWDEEMHVASALEAISEGPSGVSEIPPLVDFNTNEEAFMDALSEKPSLGPFGE